MRTRIQHLFFLVPSESGSGSAALMPIRIRIQQLEIMRIHADPDPDTDLNPKPWGGWGIYKSLSPSLSLSFFFPISLSTTVCSPSTFFLLPYISLLSSSSPSLSLSFLLKIIATFLRPFLLTFLLFSISLSHEPNRNKTNARNYYMFSPPLSSFFLPVSPTNLFPFEYN